MVLVKLCRKSLVMTVLFILTIWGPNVVPQQELGSLLLREAQYGYATFDANKKNEYRETRYNDVVSKLSHTSITAEHQELLAHALSKVYVGIPLCSYTSSHEIQGKIFEDPGNSGKWNVLRRRVQRFSGELPEGTEFISKPLYSPMSPFVYIPAIPFSLEEGTVVKKTSNAVTFSFPLDTLLFAHSRANAWIQWLSDQADWVIEFKVDKELQAPQTLKFRLAKAVKKRMQYSIDTVDVTMAFSYIEQCKIHALTSFKVRIEGSAAFRGKFVEEKRDSYTDIKCKIPPEYLHPYTPKVNFLDHIFW